MAVSESDDWHRRRSAAVIVAHPDDETLWAGGTVLMHPGCRWRIVTLCRAGDPDRAPKFRRVCRLLDAAGAMGELDDGAAQEPLEPEAVRRAVVDLLGGAAYDLVLTHGPHGEYTRHRRHEEASRAVVELWEAGELRAAELWMFAYEDGRGAHLPRAAAGAHRRCALPEPVWEQKHSIITDVYGFGSDGFEARTTPREEAFWCFRSAREVRQWLDTGGSSDEGPGAL
jgi:LmbE family N-acetylglucosaminyl deacetylase